MARRRKSPAGNIIAFIILFGLLAWALVYILSDKTPTDQSTNDKGSGTSETDDGGSANTDAESGGNDVQPGDENASRLPPPGVKPEDAQVANQLLAEGLAQFNDKPFEAREALSKALLTGALSDADADACRAKLTALADKYIFTRAFFDEDPLFTQYVLQPNDSLWKLANDKQREIYVPHLGIALFNRLADPGNIRQGIQLKLPKGPVDAVVTKHTFTIDLYMKGVFLRSYRVGLGSDGNDTPAGRWQVATKDTQTTWTPPNATGPTGQRDGPIKFNDPGYPLGPKGLWIGLVGLDAENEIFAGYGIHGTNDPGSIGQRWSMGCIRLAGEDVQELFDLVWIGRSQILVRD